MKTHADETKENINQSGSPKESKTQGKGLFRLINNRLEMFAQRKLQEIAVVAQTR